MLSKTPFRIAGAAMLGTVALLGTNAANAVIDIDAETKTDAAATYANETLTTMVDDAANSAYYVITDAGTNLNIQFSLGNAGAGGRAGDVIHITVTLEGMIFNTALADGSLAGTPIENADRLSGGMKGDNMVSYIADGASGIDNTTAVTLTVADLGIMPGGSGSVMVAITNTTLAGRLANIPGIEDPGMKSGSYSGAVRAESAVDVTVTEGALTAIVADRFMSFGTANAMTPDPRMLTGVIGRIATAADTDALVASTGAAVADLAALITTGGDTANTVAAGGSGVTVHGDFSFAKTVWFDDVDDDVADPLTQCNDSTKTEARRMTGDGMVDMSAMDLQAQSLNWVSDRNLCIELYNPADDAEKEKAMGVPEGGYSYTTAFARVGGGMAPANRTRASLGMIERDGTSVVLPSLTTDERYNQRLVMVNRSSSDARYYLDFHSGMAGDMAEGTIPMNSTTTLRLWIDDVVSFMGDEKPRTSAELTIEAQPGSIGVATQQVNRDTGGTDTVVYTID